VKLKQESDFAEVYQLNLLPKQLIVTKDSLISYIGPRIENAKLLCHLDFLSSQSHALYDEIKNFKLVRSNVDEKMKFALMDYLKYID
jgi:hypothetical protein